MPSEDKIARQLVLEAEMFEVYNDVLFYISPAAPNTWRLEVPQCLKQTLLKEHHDGRFAGHLQSGTLCHYEQKIMVEKVCEQTCGSFVEAALCVTRKGTGQKTRPLIQPIPVGGPFEMVGVDVLQLSLSHQGNQYAIVFQDYLTKWPEVFAVEDQKAETITHLLVEQTVCRHEVPS